MLVQYWFFSSDPVLILKPRFLRLHGTVTSVLASTSWYQGFGSRLSGGLFAFVSFWYWFGSISVPFWLQIRLWYWNLAWLEPKLSKFWASEYRICGCFGILGFRPTLLVSHDSFKITYENRSITYDKSYLWWWLEFQAADSKSAPVCSTPILSTQTVTQS